MTSPIKRLGKDSFIYGLGGILAKGIGFFLLPVYTRIFTPAEYGVIEMLAIMSSLLSTIIMVGLDSAQSFYYFKDQDNIVTDKQELISSILQWKLGWGILVVLLATSLSPIINALLFNGKLSVIYFAVAFSGALITQILNQSVEIYRLLFKPWSFITFTTLNTIISATLILVLVIYFEKGILGYFVGAVVASIIVALFSWWNIRKFVNFKHFYYRLWPKLLKFGAPLLPAGLAMYIMSTSDRWFIQYYFDETELGIYAVGAKFALIMALAIEMFRKAWWPIAMEAINSKDGPETIRLISRIFMGFGLAGVVYVTYLSPWLVKWFTANDYHDAYKIVGILAWQSLFYGFYLFATLGIWKREKTKYIPFLMSISAILNIILNIILVPIYGGVGAALATAIVFFILTLITLLISERLWNIGFEFNKFAIQLIASVCSVIVIMIMYSHNELFAINTLLAHFMVIMLIVTSIPANYRKYMINKLLK